MPNSHMAVLRNVFAHLRASTARIYLIRSLKRPRTHLVNARARPFSSSLSHSKTTTAPFSALTFSLRMRHFIEQLVCMHIGESSMRCRWNRGEVSRRPVHSQACTHAAATAHAPPQPAGGCCFPRTQLSRMHAATAAALV